MPLRQAAIGRQARARFNFRKTGSTLFRHKCGDTTRSRPRYRAADSFKVTSPERVSRPLTEWACHVDSANGRAACSEGISQASVARLPHALEKPNKPCVFALS